MLQFLYTEVLDPQATKQKRTPKVTKKALRKYIECFGAMGSKMVRVKDKVEQPQFGEPESLKKPKSNITAEDEAKSKITSRKILAKLHQNLLDIMGKIDHLEDGIVLRSELCQAILDSKVPDLNNDEMLNLLKI